MIIIHLHTSMLVLDPRHNGYIRILTEQDTVYLNGRDLITRVRWGTPSLGGVEVFTRKFRAKNQVGGGNALETEVTAALQSLLSARPDCKSRRPVTQVFYILPTAPHHYELHDEALKLLSMGDIPHIVEALIRSIQCL